MSDQYVIDAGVLIKAYVREQDSTRVQTVLNGLNKAEPDLLYAPEFCLVECTNVLWKHVRFHGMPIAQAERSIDEMTDLPLNLVAVLSLLPRALSIGLSHQLPIYDSLYIALADTLKCPLLTVDVRQAAAAKLNSIDVKPLTDFPELTEQQ